AYELKNNIVTGSQWGILVNKASTIDYNDVWGNTDNNYGMSVASSIIPSSGLKGAHDISVDPDFVNVAGNDVRLYEGSLCLASGENGLNMGAYAGTGVAYVPAPLNVQHLRNIGGWGTEAGRFSAPTDVSVARWGSAIYVTDSLNFRVQKLTVDGRPLGTFGSFGSGPGQFGGPIQTAVGVATGPVSGEVTQNDLLYVADPGNFRVQLFMAGKYVTSFGNRGNGPGQFEAVSWVAAAPRTNTVYVSDEVLNRVQVFSALGVYQRTIGAGVLSGPRALAVRNLGTDDSAAALYVLDGGNNRIAVFTGTELTASWSGDFAGAASLHVADNSRVYVSDARGWVTMYSGAGRYLGKFGASGVDALQFQQPKGLATDPAGYLYIADSLNDRVQKVWIAGDDVTAPGPVTPSAAYVSPWYTLLSFNAAGDDGVAGTAAWYDVRYSSTSALTTPEAFEAAMPSYIPYQPKSAGADEMITASGLEPGHTYSMALRVYDESGNYVQSAPVAFTTSVKVPTGHLLPYAGFDDMYVSRNDGYPAVIAWLGAPAGLAVDQSGSGLLYAASVAGEENSSLIRAIAPGTNIIATAAGLIGSGYAGDGGDAWRATLNNPRGVAVDPAGNLLIADTGNNRIRRVDKQTNAITTIAGTGAAGYSGDGGQALSAAINAPGGIAVDGAGNIYFADSGNNVIRKISASGVITTLAGNGTTGYNGENIAATAAMLSDPRDVKLDTAGNLYITEAAGHRIRRISAQSGVITTLAGTGVAGSSAENVPAQGAQVNSPSGLAIDPNGVVYFAEAGGHRVRKIGLDGIVRTVAGTGVDGTAQEGPSALASQLSSPKGIAGDWSRGLLYIADAERITALGVTVAPVTAGSIEGPQFKAFGLTVISTYTPVSLNVPAGSGVQGTYYQLTDLKTSEAGAVTVYSSSFTLAQGTWLIRYWSVDADGNAEATKELRVAVTPWLDTALLAAGTITAAGNAAVTGPAITNSLATLSGNTVINGPLTALRVTISGNASVSGQLSTGTATADAAPLYLPNLLADSAGANNNAAINSHLSDGALTLAGSNSLVLSTGVYYLKGLILSGSSKITLTGPVELIVDGDIKLSGSAAINKDGAASNLLVFVSTNGKVELGGSAVLSAYVYAPQAALSLGGNTALTGHYFAGSAALAGSAVLAVAAPPGRSRTMAAAGVSGYATVQAIATFQPGEWYAFPNPSKTGAVTFHFECGVADQAGVVVSDISGHKVHEANMGAASIINGKYAYRHIWNVNNTASGVYIYILRAKKAGEGTIVKKGKVAVIR
ncbi:MAG TPA: hypothetical protein DCZ92_02175, partial [Elusimicrobia bacterium]|nr:hypothetical protein [Elusimicrobiota bacterium]